VDVAAFGAAEGVYGEHEKRVCRATDEHALGVFQGVSRWIIVCDKGRGAAREDDLNFFIFLDHQMIEEVGAVVVGQTNACADHGARDRAKVGGAAERRADHQAVRD